MKKLYIIGAGGFGREVAWLVERINKVESTWELCGFVDDDLQKLGKLEGTYPVVGTSEFFAAQSNTCWAVCAVGSAKVRRKIIEKLNNIPQLKFATLVDPSVLISDRVQVGEGSIICAGTIITVDISIGNHVIINLDCTIGHDAQLSDYLTLYPSVNISGGVSIGECSEIGTGAQIKQGATIAAGTIIGAGAAVVKDITEEGTYVGVPARKIK